VKGRRQQTQAPNGLTDMGETMRPSDVTPPISLSQQAQPTSSASIAAQSLYPSVLPNNHDPSLHHHHPHAQYGAFSSGFTGQMAAAVACSSSAYPTFFPSTFSFSSTLIELCTSK
jgi:hypothetical protein